MSDTSSPFVHLHQHTEYSLLDSTVRIPDLIKKAKGYGVPAVAITDHGNLFGGIEFYQQATSAGLKPIIGCETYMTPVTWEEESETLIRDEPYHFLLLAENEEGYRNLLELVSKAHLGDYYCKPRITRDSLAKNHKGLIAITGCLQSELAANLLKDRGDKAVEFVRFCKDLFGDRFYLEIQNHGLAEQRKINPLVAEIGRRHEIPLVATNDVHYLEREHARAHEILIRIQRNTYFDEAKGHRHGSDQFYFKSATEMQEALGEYPVAMEKTWREQTRLTEPVS